MMEEKQGNIMLVLGARQMALGLFLLIVMVGSFGAVAYVIGRMVMPLPAAAEMAPNEQILVVEAAEDGTVEVQPVSKPAPPVTSSRRAASERAKPIVTPHIPSASARSISIPPGHSYFREPTPGQVFLQVSATNRGIGSVFGEYLTRRGFPAQIARGPDEISYRVLVGPIKDSDHLASLRSRLEQEGFQPFVRRYKKEQAD